jgi:uncharacterized SAM-binding protein YcdF (DUF218 family)
VADGRVVAVLGYSRRGDVDLHARCLERLRCAESLAEDGDLVLFTGSGRAQSEAELMARAWRGDRARLFLDHDSRSTAANARAAARYALAAGATEVVAVTSSWHRPRAEVLLRAALRGSGVRLRTVGAGSSRPLLPVLREAACAAILPVQVAATLTRGRSSRAGRAPLAP